MKAINKNDWLSSVRCGLFSGILVFVISLAFFILNGEDFPVEMALYIAMQFFFVVLVMVRVMIYFDRISEF